MRRHLIAGYVVIVLGFCFLSAQAQEQNTIGAGNQQAFELSRKSQVVQRSYWFLLSQAAKIRDPQVRKETEDAIANPKTCIQHRANLTQQDKQRILENLVKAGLIVVEDQTGFPGGLMAGVFPPVNDDGSACPHLPQPFFAAPGSEFEGHHSYPGGLAIHEAKNEMAAVNLASDYSRTYGQSYGKRLSKQAQSQVFIDEDVVIAAPIWHDWAKAIVFQWNKDGTEFRELSFGGNGAADNDGNTGNSKTGAHHILGLAEAMKRGFDPVSVITQASAHAAPTMGNEFKVVNWLRAAAIIAQIDPVEKGYLTTDKHGRLRLPPVRKLSTLDLLNADPPQTNLIAEYTIHNLSDSDFILSTPAITTVQIILRELAPEFGFDANDTASYNNDFRNPVLSFLTAERLLMIYGNKGLQGVRNELRQLRVRKLLQ
ncbi:MAG TPA: hypothetical protein VKD65_04130 [Candidatus Angelobacter sp.]|nr:hypothetical protein [Candidatus Angelobacter sp.]